MLISVSDPSGSGTLYDDITTQFAAQRSTK